jgi:hypothetical protein
MGTHANLPKSWLDTVGAYLHILSVFYTSRHIIGGVC